MAKIVILGAGVMGSAFSVPLAENGHEVSLVGTHLDGDIIEEVHQSRLHPRLGVHLAQTVRPYTCDRLHEVIPGADLVVLGVNSLGVNWAADVLGPILPPHVPVLMLTKGLEGACMPYGRSPTTPRARSSSGIIPRSRPLSGSSRVNG